MTTNFVARWGMIRRCAWLAVMLAASILLVRGSSAQDEAVSPERARQALDLAIQHYKARDFETAEGYFIYAQSGQQHLAAPQRKDLKEFRTKNLMALNTKRDGAVQLQLAEQALQEGRFLDVDKALKALNINEYLSPQEKQRVADLSRRLQPPPGKTDAKSLLVAGRAALQMGNLKEAESLAVQAEKANSTLAALMQPWGDSPSKLRRDIQTARAKQDQALAPKNDPQTEPTKSTSKFTPNLWPFAPTAAQKKEEQALQEKMARKTLEDGYRFLEFNNLDSARMFALKAKEFPVNWAVNEPTPDTLLQEIQRRTSNPVAAPQSTAPPKDGDPRSLLRLGRALLAQKKFDEADKVCNQAASFRDARWGLFEDTPDKLRNEIRRIRVVSEREDSFKVAAEARKLFTQGNLDEAEKQCYLAKKLHGPYGVFDFGDRPDKLIEEIARVRLSRGIDPTRPSDPLQIAKKETPNKNVPPGPAPEVVNANKGRAMVMVRDARECERQGMFLEAKQRALEARALQARFNPEEDSPDRVLQSVLFQCDKQIQGNLQQATELVAQTADAKRFEKAGACITQARRIAQAFELDASRIDQAAYYVQQVASGAQPFNNAPAPFNPNQNAITTGDPQRDAWLKAGREMLHHAQLELANKKCANARKICEALRMQPAYGMQQEVDRLVRSIMAEEYNQQLVESRRTFDAALDSFLAKDYRKALFLFQEVNPQTLPEQYQTRMRDIMSTPEMQPSIHVKQASLQPDRQVIKGGKIDVKDPPARGVGPDRDNVLDDWKGLQLVQIQQLRQQGVDVMRRANEMFNRKEKEQKEKAIDTLQQYVNQINLAQLEPIKANELRRMPEARMQQYRNLMDQDRLVRAEKGMKYAMFHDEAKMQRDDVKVKEQIYEKMKLANELMKQNKYKEAQVLVKQVRELDRDNVAAVAADRIIEYKMNQEADNSAINRQERFFLDMLALDPAPSLDPLKKPMDFGDRKYVERRRDAGSGAIPYQLKDAKERAIEYRLRQPISLHLKDRPLQDAIRDLTAISGIQVIADLQALNDARINLDAPLSISVEEIDMKFALNILLKPLKLSYTIEDQVLKITTDNNTKNRVVRITYPIADLVIAVENHPLPPELDVIKAIGNMSRSPQFFPNYMNPSPFQMNMGAPVSSHGSGQYATDPSAPGGYSLTKPGGAPGKRTPEDMANVLMGLIRGAVAKNSWEEMGGTGHIQYFPFGMALVINQSQEVQEEVQQLLQSLRRLQDLQVSVELRAVLVSETFFERIGVDFNMNIQTPTSRNEPNLVNGTFVPAPFVNRTGAGLGGLISGLTSAGTLTPDLNIPIRNSTFNFTTPQFGGYQPEAGLQLGLAFLSDIQVFMFLEAVQGDRRAHIMQAPKITVYNGQQATIGGFMTRPQVIGLIPVQLGNNQIVMMPNMSTIPFGLAMTVQPVVSPDRRFIRLNVTPIAAAGQQDPAAAQLIVTSGGVQSQLDGGGIAPAFANNPLNVQIVPTQVQLTIANTTVNVPDGGTVLLGGFRFLAEERTEYGPPILSKIPYLSRLFRNVGWSRDGSTLIYLVTARVIMVEEEERLFLGEIPPIPGR